MAEIIKNDADDHYYHYYLVMWVLKKDTFIKNIFKQNNQQHKQN